LKLTLRPAVVAIALAGGAAFDLWLSYFAPLLVIFAASLNIHEFETDRV
jgi:hypothetical protein